MLSNEKCELVTLLCIKLKFYLYIDPGSDYTRQSTMWTLIKKRFLCYFFDKISQSSDTKRKSSVILKLNNGEWDKEHTQEKFSYTFVWLLNGDACCKKRRKRCQCIQNNYIHHHNCELFFHTHVFIQIYVRRETKTSFIDETT